MRKIHDFYILLRGKMVAPPWRPLFSLKSHILLVSHTTDDLVFIWDPQMPLDVDKGIELPQLELISTKNDDCTTEYSTGTFPPAPDPLPPAWYLLYGKPFAKWLSDHFQ